jgi:hypothetical protein
MGTFVAAALLVALALAFFVSPHASNEPDGLSKVANEEHIDRRVRPHALAGMPTSGYSVKGIDDPGLSSGVAGVIGVVVVFVAGVGLFAFVRRSKRALAAVEG